MPTTCGSSQWQWRRDDPSSSISYQLLMNQIRKKTKHKQKRGSIAYPWSKPLLFTSDKAPRSPFSTTIKRLQPKSMEVVGWHREDEDIRRNEWWNCKSWPRSWPSLQPMVISQGMTLGNFGRQISSITIGGWWGEQRRRAKTRHPCSSMGLMLLQPKSRENNSLRTRKIEEKMPWILYHNQVRLKWRFRWSFPIEIQE